ncbi:MAG: hypothetical protein GYA46_02010 [candidate division Zixibacteria bacterium]|nr:hypothetical protein [candidate division Zixibacteria bacterium]
MTNGWRRWGKRLSPAYTVLTILTTLGYLLGTHLSTINSLKTAIAAKAERSEVELLDKKLTRIEVKLEEAIMTKNEFNRLRDDFDRRIVDLMVRLNDRNREEAVHGR